MRTVELAVRTAMTQLGCALLERLLSIEDGHAGQWVDCGQGHQAEFVGYRDKTLDTVLGRIGLRRAYYHCRACQRGVVPRDSQLGVDGRSLSPGLRRMVARVAAVEPFAGAADLLADLAGVRLSTKRVERAAEADGQAAAVALAAQSRQILAGAVSVLPPSPLPDMLYIEVDGTGVPVVPSAATDRAGKGEDGRARTREVKLACLFTQTKLDEQGHPVRDPDTASYVHTLDPVEQFSPLVHAEARRRGADHVRQLVFLGDGARWIWNMADKILPEATQIVDYYHAREHVHDLARQLAPTLGEHQPAWLADRLTDLDHGDIETLVEATRALPTSDLDRNQIDTALDYFIRNAQRMRYAVYRDLGMFIGSGVVEAGCKTIVGHRLKLSGMRWNIPGATGILTLRCHRESNRWDQIWPHPHNQTSSFPGRHLEPVPVTATA
jgi:Uncharacterised protein family (UPF0236)